MDNMSVRNGVIRFLHDELVGPRPGLPLVQLDGEEVLAPQDPPRLRYGAGILFPSKQLLEQQEDDSDAAETEPTDEESGGGGADGIEATGETDENADQRGDTQSETDRELNRANEFLPSALGITVLMRLPGRIRVDVSAAQYSKVDFPGEGYTNREGDWVSTPYWFRKPLNQPVEIESDLLLDDANPIYEEELVTANDDTRLVLHVYSRSAASALQDPDASVRFVTFTLVNRTPERERPRDEDCFFQCGLKEGGSGGEACFLEYPERIADGTEIGEELVLELLYRHQKVFAVGHGCSADWREADGAAAEVISLVLPAYEIPPILPAAISGLELSMLALSDADRSEPLDLCRRLADGYENWIKAQRAHAGQTGNVPPHLQEAAEDNSGA